MPSAHAILFIFTFILATFSNFAFAQHETAYTQHRHDLQSTQVEYAIELGWESKFVSEGRDNLTSGGVYWSGFAAQYQNLNGYARVGRGDREHFVRWELGLEYTDSVTDTLEATIGYQRLEFYGDERTNDNELFSTLTYNGFGWVTPSINYTYATEAGGYFIELALYGAWQASHTWRLSPYALIGLDYQLATEQHNGLNHIQFGLESEYALSHHLNLTGHISHSIALDDIEKEVGHSSHELNETFAGIYLNWTF